MDDPRRWLSDEWKTVERMIAFICRRYGLRGADAHDFASIVAVKLYENDCSIIRQYRGESQPQTYLRTVIQRIYLDERVRSRGKWHPSGEASRLGPAAEELERMVYREGLPLDQAIARVRGAHPEVTHEAAESLFARLPRRVQRSMISLDDIALTASAADQTDMLAIDHERRKISREASAVIRDLLATLEDRDRLMLQLQFESNIQLSQIARSFGVDQMSLYRRRQKIYGQLAKALAAAGIAEAEVRDLIGHLDEDVDFGLKTRSMGPSTNDGSAAVSKGARQ
jgi:RNA polymerase sigma factor (sigma-70 family)